MSDPNFASDLSQPQVWSENARCSEAVNPPPTDTEILAETSRTECMDPIPPQKRSAPITREDVEAVTPFALPLDAVQLELVERSRANKTRFVFAVCPQLPHIKVVDKESGDELEYAGELCKLYPVPSEGDNGEALYNLLLTASNGYRMPASLWASVMPRFLVSLCPRWVSGGDRNQAIEVSRLLATALNNIHGDVACDGSNLDVRSSLFEIVMKFRKGMDARVDAIIAECTDDMTQEDCEALEVEKDTSLKNLQGNVAQYCRDMLVDRTLNRLAQPWVSGGAYAQRPRWILPLAMVSEELALRFSVIMQWLGITATSSRCYVADLLNLLRTSGLVETHGEAGRSPTFVSMPKAGSARGDMLVEFALRYFHCVVLRELDKRGAKLARADVMDAGPERMLKSVLDAVAGKPWGELDRQSGRNDYSSPASHSEPVSSVEVLDTEPPVPTAKYTEIRDVLSNTFRCFLSANPDVDSDQLVSRAMTMFTDTAAEPQHQPTPQDPPQDYWAESKAELERQNRGLK